jgi:hypothetical protein
MGDGHLLRRSPCRNQLLHTALLAGTRRAEQPCRRRCDTAAAPAPCSRSRISGGVSSLASPSRSTAGALLATAASSIGLRRCGQVRHFLVGREEELDQLLAAWRQAKTGEGPTPAPAPDAGGTSTSRFCAAPLPISSPPTTSPVAMPHARRCCELFPSPPVVPPAPPSLKH